jgi:hypothetical protein
MAVVQQVLDKGSRAGSAVCEVVQSDRGKAVPKLHMQALGYYIIYANEQKTQGVH